MVIAEIKALQSNLTLEEVQAKQVKLGKEVVDVEIKLTCSLLDDRNKF